MYQIPEYVEIEQITYYNSAATEVVPSLYVMIPASQEQKSDDLDLASLAEQSKAFDFLNDPAENIYDLNDGKSV
jgi:hypothetical protein